MRRSPRLPHHPRRREVAAGAIYNYMYCCAVYMYLARADSCGNGINTPGATVCPLPPTPPLLLLLE